jgi:hypothetical protein
VFQKKNLPFSIINIFVSLPHVNPELSDKFRAAAIKNWWCDATWEICFFMLHNPYKS